MLKVMNAAFYSSQQRPTDIDQNGASGDLLVSFGYIHKKQGWPA
jgi:hypothetical protein